MCIIYCDIICYVEHIDVDSSYNIQRVFRNLPKPTAYTNSVAQTTPRILFVMNEIRFCFFEVIL